MPFCVCLRFNMGLAFPVCLGVLVFDVLQIVDTGLFLLVFVVLVMYIVLIRLYLV